MPETSPSQGLIPAPTPLPWSRPGVLVGVDGSPASRAAVGYAAKIAPLLGLPLHLLVAWDYPTLLWSDSWAYYPEGDEDFPKTADELAADEVARAFPDGLPDWVTAGTRRGAAATVLIDASREAELLVIGSRGRGGFTGLLLGSVSQACVSHCHCPVVVVRNENPDNAPEA